MYAVIPVTICLDPTYSVQVNPRNYKSEVITYCLKRIIKLIEDISRNGNEGIGKPEPLVGDLAGFWSRRINEKDRLIYKIEGNSVYILACRYHYDNH